MISKFKGFFVLRFCWTDQDAVWETERNNRCEIPGFSPAFLRKEITQRVRTIQRNYAAAALDCSVSDSLCTIMLFIHMKSQVHVWFPTRLKTHAWEDLLRPSAVLLFLGEHSFFINVLTPWSHGLMTCMSFLPFPTPNTTNTVTPLRGACTPY